MNMKGACARFRECEYFVVALVEEDPQCHPNKRFIIENHNSPSHKKLPDSVAIVWRTLGPVLGDLHARGGRKCDGNHICS